MKHDYLSRFLLALLLILAVAAGVSHAQGPLGTAFTYQGQLKQDGKVVNGTCAMRFGLWTAATGGTLIGSLLERPGVVVTEGLFTVADLDFGAGAFNGTARWLEISVSCPAGTGFTTLTPRQPITPAPYAIYSLGVPWSGVAGIPAGFADGTDNDTTYTAGTGLISSGAQFSVSVPFRLPQGCTNGYIPKWDNAGGTWVCDPGAGTTYSAGNGLDLVGNVFSVLYGGNGTATTVSRSDHDHDVRYYTEIEMQAAGGAALHWNNLTNVPGGFGDGTDNDTLYTPGAGLALAGSQFSIGTAYQLPQGCSPNDVAKWDSVGGVWICDPGMGTTYSAGAGLNLVGTTFSANFGGNGTATTVSRSDHEHDARYYTETELSTDTAAQVHWNNLASVPSGLGDGDNDTTYTAGSGLNLVGTQFSVNTSAIQARVGSTCGVGSSIRAINADGTVVCDSAVPIGMVIDWWRPRPTDPLPYGYVVCDGSVVSDPQSPIVGAVLPNLTNRFVRGLTDVGALPNEGYTIGGVDTHDHTTDLPDHVHGIDHDHGGFDAYTGGPTNNNGTWMADADYYAGSDHYHGVWIDVPLIDANSQGHDPAPVTSSTSNNVPAYVGLLKLCRIK